MIIPACFCVYFCFAVMVIKNDKTQVVVHFVIYKRNTRSDT